MCDMRGFPEVFEIRDDGKLVCVDAQKLMCHATKFDDGGMGCPHYSKVTDNGVYHVVASGSFYAYYNDGWYSGYEDEWDSFALKYGTGRTPYHGIPNKYRFVWKHQEGENKHG